MLDFRIRGFVTPEDFTGTDSQRLQQALDFAAESDIRKVVLTGEYHAEQSLVIPAGMYLVLEGAKLYANLENKKSCNFSFEQDRIYIQGGNIIGNLQFYHTRHVILENVQVHGDADFAFSRDMRIEQADISGTLTLGRGCCNIIAQNLRLGALQISSRKQQDDVIGRDPTVRNIAVRDSQIAGIVSLTACEDFGLLNIQADHCGAKQVIVGQENNLLPPEKFTNFTLCDLTLQQGVVLHNPCRNAHIQQCLPLREEHQEVTP